MDQHSLGEWATLNVSTIFTVFIADIMVSSTFVTFCSGLSILALTFYNIMRGIRVYQDIKANERKSLPLTNSPIE